MLKSGYSYLGGPGMVDQPGDVCLWHQASFVDVLEQPPVQFIHYDIMGKGGWYGVVQTMCMHCATMRPMRSSTSPGCCCHTCGSRHVRTLVRIPREEDQGSANFVAWKDPDSSIMWVREWNGEASISSSSSLSRMHGSSSGSEVEWYFPLLNGRRLLTHVESRDDYTDIEVTML